MLVRGSGNQVLYFADAGVTQGNLILTQDMKQLSGNPQLCLLMPHGVCADFDRPHHGAVCQVSLSRCLLGHCFKLTYMGTIVT